MSWVAAAVAGSAVVGAAASSRSASKAAGAQRDAANQASQTELDMYYQNREDQSQYRDVGGRGLSLLDELMGLNSSSNRLRDLDSRISALDKEAGSLYTSTPYVMEGEEGDIIRRRVHGMDLELAKLRGERPGLAATAGQEQSNPLNSFLLKPFGMEDFQKDPGYEFRQSEGMKGLEGSAAARGGLLSGATLRALTRYNQDFASNEFTNAFNRDSVTKGNIFSRLSGVSGSGQAATNQVGNYGAQTAQNVGNYQTQAGNARAAGYIGQGNALSNGIGQGVNWYNQNNMLNMLNGGGGGAPGSSYMGSSNAVWL